MILKLEDKMRWSFLPYTTFLTDETDKDLTVGDFSNVIIQCMKSWMHITELVQN